MTRRYDPDMMSFDEIDEYDDYSGPIEMYGLDGFDDYNAIDDYDYDDYDYDEYDLDEFDDYDELDDEELDLSLIHI